MAGAASGLRQASRLRSGWGVFCSARGPARPEVGRPDPPRTLGSRTLGSGLVFCWQKARPDPSHGSPARSPIVRIASPRSVRPCDHRALRSGGRKRANVRPARVAQLTDQASNHYPHTLPRPTGPPCFAGNAPLACRACLSAERARAARPPSRRNQGGALSPPPPATDHHALQRGAPARLQHHIRAPGVVG